MRPDNCTFDEFQAWFQGECNSIAPELGADVILDFAAACRPAPPWTIQLAIITPDGMYIYIYEHYRQLARALGAGGRLQYFTYHYGPCSSERDELGFPTRQDVCVLRIDIPRRFERHAHYGGEDHIPEDRLIGLDFDAITPFDFIRAVMKHRETHTPLPELLGFKVVPKA